MLDCILAIMNPEGWSFGFNDPSLMSWGIVAGYFIGATLCSKRYRMVGTLGRSVQQRKALLLWGGLALGLLLLGINKQIDLQTWLTSVGRQIATEQGWYQQRRLVQVLFVSILGLTTIVISLFIATRLNKASRRSRIALLGAAFLASYVITRAASFHHLDAMLKIDLAGFRLHWLLEMGGIACVALAAAWKSPALPSSGSHAPAPAH